MKRLKNIFFKMVSGRKPRVIRKGKPAPAWLPKFRGWIYVLAVFALLFLVLEAGLRWELPTLLRIFSSIIDYLVFAGFLADAILTFIYTTPKTRYLRRNWLDLLVLAPILFRLVTLQIGSGLIVMRYAVHLLKLFTRSRKFSVLLRGIRLNTAQVVALSFIGTILIGTFLLTFPVATVDGRGAALTDALFTSTSATCVTGLIVQDTPVYWSRFGQLVILALIQIGGLGIMTYSAFIALLLGKFSLGQRKLVQEMLEEERNVFNMITYIFLMTVIVEAAGALLLFSRWIFIFKSPAEAAYLSIFHSISAFCNAGFSLFSDSLEGFASDPAVNLIIMALIILGGLGFIVVSDITFRIRHKKRLTPHSRLVLITSLMLGIVGFFAIFFIEFDGTLIRLSLPGKLLGALFQSITPRTAGFNTVPIGALKPETLTLIMILMFIGASPGSTGGGIKTSTFAILVLSVISFARGKGNVELFKRSIPARSVFRALAVLMSALTLIAVIFILLLFTEQKAYLHLLFETVSAFGTVGLSTGITPALSETGKMLITLLMYLGRIGPLTFGLALVREITRGRISYPSARIMIG